ncbi:MAG: nucleoside hydrolase [Christensenellales bacterium]
MKKRIILDCDPGHDDAVAIMLAGRNPVIDIAGISVVAGNQTLQKTVNNTLHVCDYLGIDVPVFPGCIKPLVREKNILAAYIHGESGLDGAIFPPLGKQAEKKHGVQFIIDTLQSSGGEITVVTTGPLTNLAMALNLEPGIVHKIRELVFMGGCYQLGNITPAAEFNIFADGDAAHVVFSSGLPMTMIGLDVTRKVQCLPLIMERMARINGKASKLFQDVMGFANRMQKEVYGFDGSPLHDPVTVAYLMDPSVLTIKPMHVEVDIRSEQSYGRTNCDYFGCLNKQPNMNVAIDINVHLFWDIIEAGLRRYE